MPTRTPPGTALAVCLLLLVALAGCGDDHAAGQPALSVQRSAGGSSEATNVRDCTVVVVLSGAVTRTLRGPGHAVYDIDAGPRAFYRFTSGDLSVQVYSDGPHFTASVVVSTRSGSFSSEPGSQGLDVSTTGRRAEVDAETVGPDENPDGVHVRATFTCA